MTFLGTRSVWGGEGPFGLCRGDRRQHVHMIGKTGTGKSTLLRNMILQDIEAGEGVAVIDPHGDLAHDLLEHSPPWRSDDLVYFNPADRDHPIGFNLLLNVPPERRHLVASGIVAAFKAIWRDSWGPRLEYLLYAAVAALLDCENVSMLGVQRMLVDRQYRAWVVKQIKDPVVRMFWLQEFAGYDRRFLSEMLSPVQNKVGQLLMAPPVRNILGQVRSKIDLSFMMDNRRILIANLSKGQLGEDKASLLGALLVTQFQLAAMKRTTMSESDRKDFYLYIDEFHNFSTDSFVAILSEARKYRLCLTLSHQYMNQVRPEIADAVFGNVGSIVAFRVGEADATILAREFGGNRPTRHFTELGDYGIQVKLLHNGEHPEPFAGRTFAPIGRRHARQAKFIRRSREKYATDRRVVEDRIMRWMF